VIFAPDGKTLVSGSFEGFRLWDVTTFKERAAIENTTRKNNGEVRLESVKYSPDSKALVYIDGWNNNIKLCDVATGKERASPGGRFLAFSPDSKMLVTTSYDGVKLWDVDTGKEQATLKVVDPYSVKLSPDGNTLYSNSRYGAILWYVATGKERATIEGGFGTSLPDGKMLVSNTNEAVKLWDVATGQLRATLTDSFLCPFRPTARCSLAIVQ